MDSDVPDLGTLQALCHRFNATLLIDVAHDLGAIGPSGRGHLELQDMVGKIDIVMGSFSKSFASNGGFVATNRGEPKLALRYACGPLTFTNALLPMQAASVLACLEIIDSPEGARRRERLMNNIRYVRATLSAAGFNLLGRESAIIPVVLGDSAISRTMTAFMLGQGAIVNLVEYPAVSRNGCRWRVQVMHDHTREQIDRLVHTAVAAREASGIAFANSGPVAERHPNCTEARPLA
ncbi:MAG: aminotransferase class I/II-fold pyridoxal phosphate-dependent enzyme [Hyphomicrobiales bacterium]|nr:aminotransferase class I/II-fold pyridoxal phosphate-dependent enzyme [Hyphomicrobiales bacterium]